MSRLNTDKLSVSDGGGASCQSIEKKVKVNYLPLQDLLPAVDENSDQDFEQFDDFPLRITVPLTKKRPHKELKEQKESKTKKQHSR